MRTSVSRPFSRFRFRSSISPISWLLQLLLRRKPCCSWQMMLVFFSAEVHYITDNDVFNKFADNGCKWNGPAIFSFVLFSFLYSVISGLNILTRRMSRVCASVCLSVCLCVRLSVQMNTFHNFHPILMKMHSNHLNKNLR